MSGRKIVDQVKETAKNLDFWIKLCGAVVGMMLAFKTLIVTPIVESEVKKQSTYDSLQMEIRTMQVDISYLKNNIDSINEKLDGMKR